MPSSRRSRSRMARVARSPTTATGSQNAPAAFFAADRSTATLPPMAASAIASHVVGTWINGAPRM